MKNGSTINISSEDIINYQDLARQYARKSLLPMFEGEYSDGNLSMLPEKLDTAFTIGLSASPDPTTAGSQYGIWGSAIDEFGAAPSIMLLSIIAETCGGVAMCLHAQGLASNILLQSRGEPTFTPARVGLCLQEGSRPPGLGAIIEPGENNPAQIDTTAIIKGDSYILSGTKSFVYSMNGADGYVLLARIGKEWSCFLVPADNKRVLRTDVGPRTGIRACCVEHVAFADVEVPRRARMDDGNARELVIRALVINWMGMCAIAVGIAKGAAAAARRYAADRYQGGTQIEEHPAVKMLIAGSEAAVRTAESSVSSLHECDLAALDTLGKAAATKVMVMELCARAVTDCLQTFGGYGYMEDFGMEKRLRDVTVLKSASGPPPYLKQLVFEIEKEKAR